MVHNEVFMGVVSEWGVESMVHLFFKETRPDSNMLINSFIHDNNIFIRRRLGIIYYYLIILNNLSSRSNNLIA